MIMVYGGWATGLAMVFITCASTWGMRRRMVSLANYFKISSFFFFFFFFFSSIVFHQKLSLKLYLWSLCRFFFFNIHDNSHFLGNKKKKKKNLHTGPLDTVSSSFGIVFICRLGNFVLF